MFLLGEFKQAQERKSPGTQLVAPDTWTSLALGRYKVNVDASVKEAHNTGLVMILRNHKEKVVLVAHQ